MLWLICMSILNIGYSKHLKENRFTFHLLELFWNVLFVFKYVMLLISFSETKHTLTGLSGAKCCHSASVLILWALFQPIIIWKIMTRVLLLPAVLTRRSSCYCYTCKLHAWQSLWSTGQDAFLYVDSYFCLAKLCSDLKWEQHSVIWLTRTPRSTWGSQVRCFRLPCLSESFTMHDLHILNSITNPSRTNSDAWACSVSQGDV